VPELPEVEIAARRLDTALSGAEVDSALAPGMVALKSVKPPLEALAGREITGVRRIGKMPIVDFGPEEEPLALLVHMMSAGRLQLFAEHA
jgi:formamidopyrimidine-DNA glycosylase